MFLNMFDRSQAHALIDGGELYATVQRLLHQHMHIPEESLACVYLEVAMNLRDAVDRGTAADATPADLKNECNALLIELSSLASALTFKQRGVQPPWVQ